MGVQLESNRQNFKVKLQVFAAGAHKFVNTCIVVGESVIGDFDQTVLLGSFELSISDLIQRLSTPSNIVFSGGDNLEAIFSALYDAACGGELEAVSRLATQECSVQDAKLCVAIPTGVEAFDGEMAFSFLIGDDPYFVWRDWESKAIKWICINRAQLIAEFVTVLKCID